MRLARTVATIALAMTAGHAARAQTVTQRGFVEGAAFLFPETAPNDATRVIGDALVREELFVKPAPWAQFAIGVDLRTNSHDQVESAWRLDLADRGIRRPAVAVRKLSATVTHGALTLDAGKQFIRWGKTDIINPTDRFAPRDFLDVISPEFLPVAGVRAALTHRDDTIEGVWVPRLTPSRVPLFDQRWAALPPEAAALPVVDAGSTVPPGAQVGARWSHAGAGIEYSVSFFDGFNHLPNIESRLGGPLPVIEVSRAYPAIRGYGADAAVPTRWFTVKGEAEYFMARPAGDVATPASDDYLLYVVQLERQTGEWMLVGGYVGELVVVDRSEVAFAPDRGMTKSILGRAAYTIDPRRSMAFEAAVRQTGDGLYLKSEYSEARGRHWRLTLAGVAIAGRSDDFLGQYRRNSHAAATLRYSF